MPKIRFCYIGSSLFYYQQMTSYAPKSPLFTALKSQGYIRQLLLGWIGALLLAFPHVGWANDGGNDRHLLYEAYWGGLHVADFTLSMEKNGGEFNNVLTLESRGLTRFISNLSVVATSSGKFVSPPNGPNNNSGITGSGNGAAASQMGDLYLPFKYRTEYSNAKHFRWVDILFPYNNIKAVNQPAMAITGTRPLPENPEKWNPKDKGPEKLDKIKDEMLFGVVDPLTAMVQSLSAIETHLKGGPDHFTIKGFDGKRRFDFDVDYFGPASRTVAKIKYETYHMRITPRPIAGFKKRHKIFWEGSAFDFYLARDGSYAPIQIVPLKHGPVLNLKGVCDSPCKMPAE